MQIQSCCRCDKPKTDQSGSEGPWERVERLVIELRSASDKTNHRQDCRIAADDERQGTKIRNPKTYP